MTNIETTSTQDMMLDMLIEKLDEEPPAPDPDRDTGYLLEMRAREYDGWERNVNAWRLLISAQLVNDAIDARRAQTKEV